MRRIHALAHPNIAFIKYWGKKASHHDEDRNIGLNPSVSMTLAHAQTDVWVGASSSTQHEIFIEAQPASPTDVEKISTHIRRVSDYFRQPVPPLKIESKNNFPKGTGIASSASAFAALTYGIGAYLVGKKNLELAPLDDLSGLARRGSGSAARSVAGGYMKWEKDFAEDLKNPWQLRDTIVIFSSRPKSVSSTEGHKRVESSPHWADRQRNVGQRYRACLEALKEKNLAQLGAIIESEALEMHGIAETSLPPIQYRLPETIAFLDRVQSLSTRDFYFTLDAGPNVHLISERPIGNEVRALLTELGLEAEIWEDWTGSGPVVKEEV